jgi:hypothetical protein
MAYHRSCVTPVKQGRNRFGYAFITIITQAGGLPAIAGGCAPATLPPANASATMCLKDAEGKLLPHHRNRTFQGRTSGDAAIEVARRSSFSSRLALIRPLKPQIAS